MEKKDMKPTIVAILAAIGFCLTVELALVYYNAIFAADAKPSICAINDFMDCDSVARTNESQFFGIPLAFWGMFWYLFVFLMLKAKELKEKKLFKFMEVFKNPMDYISVLGLFSFIVSIILLCVSLFEIKKLCVFCAITYVINLAIALVATRPIKEGSFLTSLKQSVSDFLDAIKIKPYAIAFATVVALGVGVLAYTSTSLVFAPHVKYNRHMDFYRNAKMENYLISGNHLGSVDAPIKVNVYSDFDCPVCRYLHIQLYYLVKEYDNIQFVHKNYPLDKACNKYIPFEGHPTACIKARYAEAAGLQNKYNDMAAHLFKEQPETEEAILEIAKKLELDINKLKKDAVSQKVKAIIEQDIKDALSIGLAGTPAMIVGNHKKMGLNTMDEARKWLEYNGAKRK